MRAFAALLGRELRLALRHPDYGWERNVGYGTALHRAGLAARGRSPHHRLTFTRTVA